MNINTSLNNICEQYSNKVTDRDIFYFTVFNQLSEADFRNFSLTNKTNKAYCDYLKSLTEPKLESFVNMTKLSSLSKCLGKNAKRLWIAQKIATKIYESHFRPIHKSNYGRTFPMYPELLSYAAYLAKDRKVLEIAGAGGENAALLAFSQASHVFMNDICEGEINLFNDLRAELPLEISSKLTPLEGDCLNILETQPDLKKNIGLILCYNLIHFFNDDKMSQFMDLLKNLLTPDGKALIATNAVYSSPAVYQASLENQKADSFGSIRCYLNNYLTKPQQIQILNEIVYLSRPENVSTDYKEVYLYQNDSPLYTRLQKDPEGYKKMSSRISELVKNIIRQNRCTIRSISRGSVRVVESHQRLFSQNTLATLFEGHGFTVEKCILLSVNGHLFEGTDPLGRVANVAVVISKKI